MRQEKRARLMMALSMAIFGTLGPFVREIGVSSGELALYRAILAAVPVGVLLWASKGRALFAGLKKQAPLLLASGIAMGANWALLFEAYKYTSVSVATLSYYFAPVLVTALCPVLFREELTKARLLCLGLSTLGLVLMTGTGGTGGSISGILLALGAAVLYAAVILMNKAIRGVEGLHRTFLQFSAAVLVLIPYVAATGGVTLGTLSGRGWLALLTVGLIHTGLSYCMYFSALKELPGHTTALLSYIDPLVAVLVSVTVLEEALSPWQALGGALILGSTLFSELRPKAR